MNNIVNHKKGHNIVNNIVNDKRVTIFWTTNNFAYKLDGLLV